MNNSKGIATFWLLIMITIIKIFSIIFLCTLNIDVEKLIIGKYNHEKKISQQALSQRTTSYQID